MAVASLPNNTPVTILTESRGFVFVRDAAGRTRRLSRVNVDPGVELQGRSGQWYFEDHPKALKALRGHLGKLIADLDRRGDEHEDREKRRRIEEIEDIIARHTEPAKLE